MNGEWISKLCVNVQESKRDERVKEPCTNRQLSGQACHVPGMRNTFRIPVPRT